MVGETDPIRFRRSRPPVDPDAFAGFRFPPEVIMVAVRWYLRFGLSYRDRGCSSSMRIISECATSHAGDPRLRRR
jgi:transposase-like protein